MSKTHHENLHKKMTNYFVIMNVSVQFTIIPKLIDEFNLYNSCNILFYRKRLFDKSELQDGSNLTSWTEIHAIPFIFHSSRFIAWLNYFIYVFYFFIFFILRFNQDNNLIIGNYQYNGARSICNVLSKYWKRIFVLDEGLSTVKVMEQRSKLIEHNAGLPFFNRLIRSGHPKRSLLFFTNFNLTNSYVEDVVFRITTNDTEVSRQKQSTDTLLFIGTYLVESKFFSLDQLCFLLKRIREENKHKIIHYVAHPKEHEIFKLPLEHLHGIMLIRPSVNIEQYIKSLDEIPEFVASTFSTAYLYVSNILTNRVKYQTYVFEEEVFLNQTKGKEVKKVYELIERQLQGYDLQSIKVY